MDNDKFEECFKMYKNLIIRLAVDRTGDYQTAQEICQQVFAAFYVNMDTIVPGLEKAWLIRSTQNAIIDYGRKACVRKEVITDIPIHQTDSIVAEDCLDACENKMVNAELAGKILRNVKEVNERWYEVLMLHCVEGLSHAEAAKRLGIPESVLRARLHRARTYIRKTFGEEYLER